MEVANKLPDEIPGRFSAFIMCQNCESVDNDTMMSFGPKNICNPKFGSVTAYKHNFSTYQYFNYIIYLILQLRNIPFAVSLEIVILILFFCSLDHVNSGYESDKF